MPVIIVKARKGVLKDKATKAKLMEKMAQCFSEAAGDSAFEKRATVIIEEVPDENWARGGKQVEP